MQPALNEKYQQLVSEIRSRGQVAIAFSGGVDSALLSYAALEALGDKALAITVDAPQVPRWELREAVEMAADWGLRHDVVSMPLPTTVLHNPADKCYHCKLAIFTALLDHASERGCSVLMDGSNRDDLGDYRPGLKALRELSVWSPLMDLGWTKAEIRQASQALGLPTADKPAYACLLTRIPVGTPVSLPLLERIEAAEGYLMQLGFFGVRVRAHGDLARVELRSRDLLRFMAEETRREVQETFLALGFNYATVDLAGYQMGSMNPRNVEAGGEGLG